MNWSLHPQLERDTAFVADWPLCRVLLMDDSNYPWLVLVPRVAGLRDFDDVPPAQHLAVMDEIGRASRALKTLFAPHKLNAAALGNAVPQLHIHVIARQTADRAWPRPVWGAAPAARYEPAALERAIATLQSALASA